MILFPLRPSPSDVGTILLAGVQAFFEADALVLKEVPDREVTHLDPAFRKLCRQRPQRDVRLFGQARQKPVPLTLQRIRQPAANLARRAPGRPEPLRPLHYASNADLERCRHRPAALAGRNRCNNPLPKIKGIGSPHRILASNPASILNQNLGDLGIWRVL